MLHLVTVENESDGMWWTDPNGFDTMDEAKRYANEIVPPKGHVVVIYRCEVCEMMDLVEDRSATLLAKGGNHD